ncbi:hypothetical protein D3C87_505050 [compost metagenome]
MVNDGPIILVGSQIRSCKYRQHQDQRPRKISPSLAIRAVSSDIIGRRYQQLLCGARSGYGSLSSIAVRKGRRRVIFWIPKGFEVTDSACLRGK